MAARLCRASCERYGRGVHASARLAAILSTSALALTALFAPPRGSAQQRIAIADPAYGFLVEGRVLRADGRPAAGVQIERMETRNYIAESTTTDASGAFRFEAHGLGFGPGPTWTVTLRRAGCPDVTRTITLRHGPIDGRPRDEATGVVLRLPACRVDRVARRVVPTRR